MSIDGDSSSNLKIRKIIPFKKLNKTRQNSKSYHIATANFLKILSSDVTSPTIDKVIQSRIVPCFIEFLTKKHDPMLQNEAACVISKLASMSAQMIIDDGAVPILIGLASNIDGSDIIREEATLALGYVACDLLEGRDYILRCGGLKPLLSQLNENAKLSILRTATWTLSNLCRGQPPLLFDQVELVLEEIVEKVLDIEDKDILANACWSFYYLSYGSKDGIKSLIDADLVPRLVRFLQHTSSDVFVPALNTIGNIVSGDHQQTQCVINSGVLRILANMLNGDYEKRVEKDACWTVSNITAGTEEQIQLVIDANMIPTLVNLAQNARFDIKKEALFAISNATSGGSHDQIIYLVEKNCIKPLCDFLVSPDPRIISVCLDGLENILMAGETEKKYTGEVNCYTKLIDDAEGLKKIDKLQNHQDNDIYELAVNILETYWP